MSVRALADEMGERYEELRGTSYGGIRQYMEGKVKNPRAELLRAIADVLKVRAEFLLYGEGPLTEAEAVIEADREAHPDTERWRPFLVGLEAAKDRLPDLRFHGFHGQGQVLESLVIRFLRSGGRDLDSYTAEQVEEVTYLLGWLLTLPGTAVGSTDYLNEGRAEEYFLAMAAALRIAIPQGGGGFPLNALGDLRAFRKAWEDRLPRPSSPEEHEELTRDRGRSPKGGS